MKKDITVLLTGAGAPGAPGIIQCYRNNGERNIRIVGVDMNENAAGKELVDSFYKIPKAGSPDFIQQIIDICAKEKVDVVVPIVTRELMSFAENKDKFEKNDVKVSVLDSESLSIVNDKGKLLTKLKECNLRTAGFRLVNTSDELFDAIDEAGYPSKPVCVKVTNGNGSRGVRMLDIPTNDYERFFNEKPNSSYTSLEHLHSIFDNKSIPQMMVMEYLPGDEYSVDVLSDETGIRALVCRKGTKVVSSIQVECVIEDNDEIRSMCSDIITKLHLIGEFGFDIKCNKDGVPYVIEVNPRLTAGIVACAAAGCNIPYYELLRQLGETIPPYEICFGTVMTRHYKEVFFDKTGNPINWN